MLAVALVAALTGGRAYAQAPAVGGTAGVITVRGSGCPSTSMLIEALGPLLPGAQLVALADTEGLVDAQVEVVESGQGVRVTAGGDSRLLEVDSDCQERARTASLWAALRLRPPTLPALVEEPPTPESARPGVDAVVPVVPAAAAAAGTAWPLHVDLDLGGLLAWAPAEGLLSGGGSLHLAVGWGPLSAVLGGGVGSPVTIAFPVGSARVWRAPLDLDLRATLRRGRFEGDAEVGVLLAIESAEGQNLYVNRSDVRAGVGVRAGVRARWRLGRVAPFAAVGLTVEPRPYVLFVDGLGNASTLPSVWVTATLGLSVALR